MFAETVGVVLESTVYGIDKPYSYAVPAEFRETAVEGVRVTVPFGRGNRIRQGLIVLRGQGETDKLKSIVGIIDEKPLLDKELLGVVRQLKETTFCTWFDAVKTVLPYGICFTVRESYVLCEGADISSLEGDEAAVAALIGRTTGSADKRSVLKKLGMDEDSSVIHSLVKKGIITRADTAVRNAGDAGCKMIRPTSAAENGDIKLTPKQKSTLSLLFDIGCCSVKELCYFSGVSIAVVNGLAKSGAAEIFEQTYYRAPKSGPVEKQSMPTLTEAQKRAYDTLEEKLVSSAPAAALLYGVTGSGKTSVFIKLCEKALECGKGVIVMVPEIALTPQTVAKFRGLFGDKVAVFHSAMSQGVRMDEWKRVKNGDATIAVGTRSAVFAPVKNLGLIIMDEEQEHTYKSEKSPRYHARDMAKYRAAENNALLLLASATPSIETYYAAKSGRYTFCELPERYGNAMLPEVETVDMRPYLQKGGAALSRELTEKLDEVLSNGRQAILLLNRRGRNTIVSCSKCGHVMTCENCSLAMTYHSANNRLMCHCCGASVEYVNKCPECGSEHIRYSGYGTQRVEEELAELFPSARILRMDSDSTMTRDSYEKGLSAFSRGEYDIMLGTQMVAKGLDFPNVVLVGVISADQSMYGTDYRGLERTFSLLTQVVGRSGRGSEPGTAIVQTAFPDNEVVRLAAKQDYDGFFNEEIGMRKLMIYPPFCDMAQIVVAGADRQKTAAAAEGVAKTLGKYGSGEYNDVKMIVLGPTVASVPKTGGRYRYRLTVKFKNNKKSRNMFSRLLTEFGDGDRSVTSMYIDINPENFI